MLGFILIRLMGLMGLLLVVSGYYILWSMPDIEPTEVIKKAQTATVMTLFGNLMLLFYIFKR